MARTFGSKNFAVRWAVAVVVVFGTFNPTRFSYYHWLVESGSGIEPLKIVVGLALLIVYVIYLRATWRSIGPVGAALVLAFLAALVWLLVDLGLLEPTSVTPMTWIGLLVLSTVLAVGISWSHLRRRISGQLDTDDVSGAADE